jgi:hypothetical protein
MVHCLRNVRRIMFGGRCPVNPRIVAAARRELAYEPGVPQDVFLHHQQAIAVRGKGWPGIQGRLTHLLYRLSFAVEDGDLLQLPAPRRGKDEEPLSIGADVHQLDRNGNPLAEQHPGFLRWRLILADVKSTLFTHN